MRVPCPFAPSPVASSVPDPGSTTPTLGDAGRTISTGHVSVLLDDAVTALRPRAGGIYVDCTFGGGGHASRLLEHEPPVAQVVAIDADPDAAIRAAELAARDGVDGRLTFVQGNFRVLGDILASTGIDRVDGVLFDLGLSSFQLDDGDRGFSFRADAPIDMRLDRGQGQSACEAINSLGEQELAEIIWTYGEDRASRRIATAIVSARETAPITSTMQLASLVESAAGGRKGRPIHPATRTFQALRIHVNRELEALEQALAVVPDVLASSGRLVVIAFHSLEDRIVKRFIEAESRACVCPPEQPVCTCDTVPRLKRVGRPIRASQSEIDVNPRSRSAIMRTAERIGHADSPAGQGHIR